MTRNADLELVTVTTRRQWRAWLKKNHAKVAAGIWLVYFKKHTGKPTLEYEESVEEAICFGWIDGLMKRIDDERFMRKFTPRRKRSNWSATNKRRALKVIAERLMMPAGQDQVDIAKTNGMWAAADDPPPEKPKGPNGFEMPPELAKALVRNKKAGTFFDSLAPSYQQRYMAWVQVARLPETRAKRVKATIAMLKQGKKLGMV